MDNMSNTLQTVMQVQEQYRKVMEPWIKHQEMINHRYIGFGCGDSKTNAFII